MQITDEDLVPLDLFDGILAEYQHKHETKKQVYIDFIKQCREEQVKKCKQLGIESGKQKAEVEKASFANFLNTKLETNH